MSDTQHRTATAEVVAHAPGTFCWWEIATTDLGAAQAFYGGLFGWSFQINPIGEGEVYVMAQHNGLDILGIHRLSDEHAAQGIPPHWTTYLATEDTDATVAEAQALGASVVVPAFEVFDLGRMAVLQDPQGLVFCVWQAHNHAGAGLVNQPCAVAWNEITTTDRTAAEAFYGSLFGYEVVHVQMEMGPYTLLRKGGKDQGGILQMTEEWGDIPPHIMNYLSVTDCDASAARATELGGTLKVPPTDIPNVGRFAVIADPQGAVFSIITM